MIWNIDPRLNRAVLYGRKSNDEGDDIDATDKSNARQEDGGKRFAAELGCDVVRVFGDDGIGGKKFKGRKELNDLIAFADQKPRPFDVLIVSEGSRIGRESSETMYIQKNMIKRGIRIFSYLDRKERRMDTPGEKFMMSAESFADEMEWERASQRISDTLHKRAREGKSTGGRCPYGYRDQDRVRVVFEPEAKIVRCIFEWSATGDGNRRIVKRLNADRVAPPVNASAIRRGGDVWSVGAIRGILRRTLYRGVVTYNQHSFRDQFGETKYAERPRDEWIETPAPDLRIVSDAVWNRAQAAREQNAAAVVAWSHRRRDGDSSYLLVGFLKCGHCGGRIGAMKQPRVWNGSQVQYLCSDRRRRGLTVCANSAIVPMEALDGAIRGELEKLFTPATVRAILDDITRSERDTASASTVAKLQKEQKTLAAQVANLTDAIADATGAARRKPLEAALEKKLARRDQVAAELDAAATPVLSLQQRKTWIVAMEKAMAAKRSLLKRTADTRIVLRELLQGRLIEVFQTGPHSVRFRMETDLLPVIEGIAGAAVQSGLSQQRWSQLYRRDIDGSAA